ncbi:hypothetical protein B0181_11700 [Moraxella caviae]|uniref:Uncharacterized protein n=1 Tax=Moraxella caviae TaxID=34060 RepID=A0A1S9ZS80_9GAMM|nr:hypothetical protein [Moraxella caviae]OOR86375.1 hypothetical protein B0181_11700 [Moraxella caviae]STZ14488.1 Uncharacterised protein [Moraxella caviae]
MWNLSGVIPPIKDIDGASVNRSPYKIDILTFVQQFGFSDDRIAILSGFLYYREFLYKLGITDGFQWVNGSFTEDIERLRDRPPNDIDVVSFFRESALTDEQQDQLLDGETIKSQYRVDGYFVLLDEDPTELVERTAYWYSMWSHQRDTYIWKGFYQVPLSPDEDKQALEWLLGVQPCKN